MHITLFNHPVHACSLVEGAPDIFVAFSGILQDDLALVLGYVSWSLNYDVIDSELRTAEH